MSQALVRFGIIGGGLMGREFASNVARWCHLVEPPVKAQITAVASGRESTLEWFKTVSTSIAFLTTDYRQLLERDDVDCVYVAVPHLLHAEVYQAVLRSGKHLLGEKPFGIDLEANAQIIAAANQNPSLVTRCSSEFPFFPGVQRIGRLLEQGAFGRIIEVNAAFQHSSDLDPKKPINWKRQIESNGAYGVMGDLGMHICHVPFRAGWIPTNVRAILSDIIKTRPDAAGNEVTCSTWDNATLLCEVDIERDGYTFPMSLRTQRIAPGERNSWSLEILGTQLSARWSTMNPKQLALLDYRGTEQVWQLHQCGYETVFKCITGPNFEFGFSDAMLQMIASFICEVAGAPLPGRFAGCVTCEEVAASHRLFTAALRSHARRSVEPV
jgi:predicted dehydrogenase